MTEQKETKSQEKDRYRKCLEQFAHVSLMEELSNRIRGYSCEDLAEILVTYHEDGDEDVGDYDTLQTILNNVAVRETQRKGGLTLRLRWSEDKD